MPTERIRQKISVVELALKDAGTDQAVNAIIDVLKEIAGALELHEKMAAASHDLLEKGRKG